MRKEDLTVNNVLCEKDLRLIKNWKGSKRFLLLNIYFAVSVNKQHVNWREWMCKFSGAGFTDRLCGPLILTNLVARGCYKLQSISTYSLDWHGGPLQGRITDGRCWSRQALPAGLVLPYQTHWRIRLWKPWRLHGAVHWAEDSELCSDKENTPLQWHNHDQTQRWMLMLFFTHMSNVL